jgi:hypothetical protein
VTRRNAAAAPTAPAGKERNLPNFLVIGAMKTGTTSLYNYLRHHPEVFMPDVKEVNFFNPMRNWRRGVSWYEEQFKDADGGTKAIGEASTSYTKFPWVRDAPSRISAVLGDIRLIYVIRDPIERMRSHYLHNLGTGQEWRSIEEAFRQEPMYANISRYALQIEQYLPYFDRERLLVIESEHLRRNRLATLRKVFEFLGVDPGWVPPSLDQEFYRSVDRQMNPSLRRKLRRIPHIRRVAMYVPRHLKRLKHKLTDELPTHDLDVPRGEISDDLRRHLRAMLREDVVNLRSFLGSGWHGWGIE